MSVKAVLFDLDGIITDTAHYHYKAWKACAKTFGIEMDEQFNENLKGIDRVSSLNRILEHGGVTLTPEQFEKALMDKNNHYLQLITQITKYDILEGIEPLLEELENKEIQRVVCSASKNAPTILKNLGIYNKFNVIVDPTTLEKGKPSPDIFIEGAKLAGVLIEECIGIEDAVAGIKAIKAAGMIAIAVGNDTLDVANPDVRLTSTSQLTLNVINNLSGGSLCDYMQAI
ncbi:MAG: beta-phosphoglucomutase [Turicibacter sp.]